MMTLEEYLTPDPNLRAPRPCPEFMPDPPPSLASREMSLHSAISVHGYTFIDGRKVWYEAILERCCALLARLRPDVIEVAEQQPAVTYVDDTGRERQHKFDFRFTLVGGARILTAVKPSALVAKTGIDRTVELIAEQISPAIADYVLLFTEKKLSQVDLFNAEVVHMATRDEWPEDDAQLAKIIRKLKGEITIGELVEDSGLGGYGYDAVIRAIDAGHIRLVEYRRLEFDALVTRAVARQR
ncbi:conserved hypothetical protein [Nitrobacter hamburgensis X14]|uniref:TnsA endonuclease N-terminal domain-containing protein n=1 Tax=Nitrobacter hamburgensis (strain DSM 10229 / NCIMB 13809 / X14) TaxID=323097 RepID=Q1QLL3_NITHX|nr:hypothetical protein [Nitrobacter hamburgensis]ABE62884.1 conserved hypothetical protein [Nitrobacter hamburgensis X14]